MTGMLKHCIAMVCLALGLTSAMASTRVALVVGNSAYKATTPLANPVHDARDVAEALKQAGFTVIMAVDADKAKFDGALRAFADQLSNAEVALLFYAGHGLQVGMQNYLIPIDAKLDRERDLEFETVRLDFVLRQMEIDRDGKTTIVILDACRDNPLSKNLARSMGTRSTAIGKGLAAAPAGLGTFIAFSTQPGNVALDGDGRNSPFTVALIKHMSIKGRNLPATMIEVRKDVVAATSGRQVPWDHSALTTEFYFHASASQSSGTVAAAPAGTGADIAALQERIRLLEENAQKRETAPRTNTTASTAPSQSARPSAVPAPPGNQNAPFLQHESTRVDGIKVSETRQADAGACQEACEADSSCVAYQFGRRSPVTGQCQLLARVEAVHQDPAWQLGLRAGTAVPTEQSAVQAAARRLPPDLKGPPSRKERGFDIYDGRAAMGQQIKMSSADSPGACQVICRNTPGCVFAVYNELFRGKNLACQVYREITNTMQTPSASIMIRMD